MPNKNALYIEIRSGRNSGVNHTIIDEAVVVLGANEECDICIPEQTVSGRHCQIKNCGTEFRIMDLDSTNGTYLNEKLIGKRGVTQSDNSGAVLNTGDRISLGKKIILEVKELSETETQIARFDKRLKGRCLIPGYRNGEILGKGGMGSVRRIIKNATGESFALKTIISEAGTCDDSLKRFQKEMNIIRNLENEHIVSVYQTGIKNDKAFILMEYCKGGSIVDLMERNGGSLSIELSTKIFLQILEGLTYLHNHELGLVHRDIKPRNILLSDESDQPCVKLSDFGIAKTFDQDGFTRFTKTGMVAGTSAFIPKQQMHFKDAGPEVDVWAAAATYYYMLTGMYPKCLSKEAIISGTGNAQSSIPIRERNMHISKELAFVIDLALKEEPDLHYRSAEQLKTDIMNVI